MSERLPGEQKADAASNRELVIALRRTDLETVLASQVERYIALGFHAEVYSGVEEEEARARYRADFVLPEDAAQPVEYAGRFDVALAVEPRIPLRRKHELAERIKGLGLDLVVSRWTTSRVEEWINTDNIEDVTIHPDVPYLVFTHDGQRYCPKTVTQAQALFAGDEVGSSLGEVTDLFLQEPRFFVERSMDAAGSRDEFGDVPYLAMFVDGPRVSASSPGRQGRDWGAASRGKDYIRLGNR